MALDKIKLANKKARREKTRKAVRGHAAVKRGNMKIQQRRTRKMMLQGRREFQQKRRNEADYISQLTGEIDGAA